MKTVLLGKLCGKVLFTWLVLGLCPAHAALPKMYAYGFDSITSESCVPMAINAQAQIVGYCWRDKAHYDTRAFITLVDRTRMRDLGDLGGRSAAAIAINDLGVVVGTAYQTIDTGSVRAFVTDPGGSGMRVLDDPRTFSAVGINNSGQIIGSYTDFETGVSGGAYITGPGGVGLYDIGTLGGSSVLAIAINSSGQVTGYSKKLDTDNFYYGFITGPNGVDMVAMDLGDGIGIVPNAMNDKGEVAGNMYLADGTRQQFRSGPNGVGVSRMGTLNRYKTGGYSEGSGIGRKGVVVGASTVKPRFSHAVATITDPRGRMGDLNTLVVNLPQGVELLGTAGINRHGEIAASGSDGRVYIVCPKEHCKR